MADSTHIDIRTMTPNMFVDGIYSILNPQVGTTRGGKPFLKGIIRDATSECPIRQWTVDESTVHGLGRTGFVWVAGHTQEYNGRVQIIVERIEAVDVSLDDMRRLLPTTRFDIDEMFAEVRERLESLKHPAMLALAKSYLDDERMMSRFKEAPAAASIHHAWIGGLLEHTRQLLRLADAMLPSYPELNRDIVLMGLFLHDLGKTAELSWDKGFTYTTPGNLIGHVVIGAMWLERKIAQVMSEGGPRLPARAHLALSHIILSHHNEPEFGAVKRPGTPEAVFVALLDNLDAKTAIAIHHADRDSMLEPKSAEQAFTDKIYALETRIFRPDPLDSPATGADDDA